MKHASNRTLFAAATGLLLLILDSRTALEGAETGIDLCIRTVIPSLFPFFIFSGLLTGSLMGRSIPLLKPLVRLTGIPPGSESILLAGFLGGYPVGAQLVAQARKDHSLTSEDAARMIVFCNNSGPAFLFGMGASLFHSPWMPWLLWLTQIGGALLVGYLLPGKTNEPIRLDTNRNPTVPEAVSSAIRAMSTVCAWVILFRILIAFLSRWIFWAIPENLQTILAGILELTNGLCRMHIIDNPGLRFVICAGMLAFGGVCVAMQTASVASAVDRRSYIPGKCLHCLISVLLALILQSFLPEYDRMPLSVLYPAAVLLLLLLIPVKKENFCSIPGKVRV